VASFLGRVLRSILPNVVVTTEYHGELFATMAHFSPNDVVIGICLDKCQGQTLEAMKFATEERKSTTVAITDSSNSLLLQYSQFDLVIKGVDTMYMDSMIGAFSLCNALFCCTAEIIQERTVSHFKFFRKLSEQNSTYAS